MKKPSGKHARKQRRREPAVAFLAREMAPVIAEARQRAAALLAELPATETEAAAASEAEDVHQLRVALRRLRSLLRHLRRVYHPSQPRQIGEALRTLASLTNPLRDAHVQAELLQDELGIDGAQQALGRGNARTLARLRGKLQAGELERPLAELEALLRLPSPSKRAGSVGKLARAAFERERAALAGFITTPPTRAEDWHRMRIVAKRLRYTLELFRPVLRGKTKPLLRAVRDLQEVLGQLHDGDVLLERLRHLDALALAQRTHARQRLRARRSELEHVAHLASRACALHLGIEPPAEAGEA